MAIEINSNISTTHQNASLSLEENIFVMPWWQQVLFITAYVILILVATIGNLVVIWIVLAHKRMRTVTNYFLVNLAVADGLISILNTLFTSTFIMYQDWWYGLAWCKFTIFISVCTVTASVLTLMAISIDRYMAIVHPLRRRPTNRVVLAVSCIWIFSIALALPNAIYGQEVRYTNSSQVSCLLVWPDGQPSVSNIDIVYNVAIIVLTYAIPMLILIITYSRIGFELWGQRTIGEDTLVQFERIQSKRRVVKMMIFVVTVFGVCWLPYHLYFVLASVIPEMTLEPHVQHVYLVIYWIAMSNSMYNPIIYCWMNHRFRNGFVKAFCSWPLSPCRRLKKRHSQRKSFTPIDHFVMAEKYPVRNGTLMNSTTYYNGHLSRKTGTLRIPRFTDDENCV